MISLRAATAADFADVVALNQADVEHLSDLTIAALARLADRSHLRLATLGDRVGGFVLAMNETSPYESVHFRWFKAKYPRFLYVDRIVVAESARRMGLGAALYRDVEAQARESGTPLVTCEINVRPFNAASVAFHDRQGFVEVGTRDSDDGAKTVSLRMKRL